jgi:hypothetical protein
MGNRNDGDVKELFHAAPPEDVIEAEYRAPFLAHAYIRQALLAQIADRLM